MLGSMSTDPAVLVPGSPASIDTAIRGWKARADHAEENRLALTKLAVPDGWQGSAPVAFTDHVRKVASTWMPLQQSLTVASGALQEYSSTLTWARDQAGVAIDTWLQAQRAEEQAPLLPTTQAAAAEVEALREKAWSILRHAQSRVTEAGDRAAVRMMPAAAQPELTPEAWQRVGENVSTPEQAAALLASLSASDIDDVLAARPDLVALLQQLNPEAVNQWWSALSTGAQHALIMYAPRVIGNLEGVTYSARDRANRLALDQRIIDAEARAAAARSPMPLFPPPSEGQVIEWAKRAEAAEEDAEALRKIRESLLATKDSVPRSLISLTDDHPPLAAVAIGDMDRATNVTFAIPGMGSSAAVLPEWASVAQNVYTAQTNADSGNRHAIVAWVGYEAPPVPSFENPNLGVLHSGLAEEGGRRLDSALIGFNATNTNATLNVLAHSYGTTTASFALSDGHAHVDTFVSVGSAGLPPTVDSSTDLHADHVFAGQARGVSPLSDDEGDAWAWIGRTAGDHPVNPMSVSFDAERFGVDTEGSDLAPVLDHLASTETSNGYLDIGTESLRNVALATTGQGQSVSPYVPRLWKRD
jgi:ElaB/YqjD/DUF883 family membrane-anchored ribosome-binding protein